MKISKVTDYAALNNGFYFQYALFVPTPNINATYLFVKTISFQKYFFCLKKRLHDQSGDKPKSHDCRKWNPYF